MDLWQELEDGGGDESPPNLDDLFAGKDLSDEPLLVDSGDVGGGLFVSKPAGDEEGQPRRIVRDPGVPSQKNIDEHESGGHATYRTWCEACVEGRGTGGPHR